MLIGRSFPARAVLTPTPPGPPVSTGSLGQTDAPDTLAIVGDVLVQGAFTQTDSPDTFASTGAVVVVQRPRSISVNTAPVFSRTW